ncbi:MAG: HAMP domain-containing sensor histidine kinase [Gemmatimonadota bacterium]
MPRPPSDQGPLPEDPPRSDSHVARSSWLLSLPGVAPLLRLPLFYKIVIGNAVIVALGASLGTAITLRSARVAPSLSPLQLIGLFTVAGLLISTLVNTILVRLALRPLAQLEATAERVKQDDLEARAPDSPVADARLARLVHLFNEMLDTVSLDRSRLRSLALRAFEAEEAERSRIARELHDGSAQDLALLMVRIEVAAKSLARDEDRSILDEIRQEAHKILEGLRRTARGLRPPELSELGVSAALQSHARLVRETTDLIVHFTADPVEPCLSHQESLAIYRVVQEALSNVVRHARASEVHIRVSHEPERIVAEVRDDGIGFDVEEQVGRSERGLGLFGMQERAAYVGGRVVVESEPGSGTRVQMEIPCVHDAEGGM